MKKIILFTVSFFCGVNVLLSQTLVECCQLARAHYPAIRQYHLVQQTRDFNVSNAVRAWIPQITFTAQATWQTDAPAFPDELSSMLSSQSVTLTGLEKDQYRLALDVQQRIWDGGAISANRQLAEARAAVDTRQVDVELYEVESRVEDTYFGILLLDERIAQGQAGIRLLQENLQRIRSLLRNGTALPSDVDQLEVGLLSACQHLDQLLSARSSYRHVLQLLIGCPLKADTLSRPQVVEPLQRVSRRHELALIEARSRQLDAQQKLIKSRIMPQLSAFAQGFYGYPGFNFFENMRNNNLSLNALLGVRLSWNLGSFNTFKNAKRQLQTERCQLNVQRDLFRFCTDLATVQQDGQLVRLEKALQDDRRILTLRRRVRQAAESQLSHGVINVTDLLQKITDETQAALNQSIHEIEWLQVQYKLKRIYNQ